MNTAKVFPSKVLPYTVFDNEDENSAKTIFQVLVPKVGKQRDASPEPKTGVKRGKTKRSKKLMKAVMICNDEEEENDCQDDYFK